jgi:hypothetical protein
MALPAQVQRQSEAVNKLYEELSAGSDEQGGTADAQLESGEGDVANDEADKDDGRATQPHDREQVTGASSTEDEEETYEQRWRSLQGMYNAEVPRLSAEKRELTSRVQQLEQLLSTMGAAGSKQAPQTELERLVTDQDVEDYGDSIDVMRRVFREEASSLKQENQQLRAAMQQMQASVVPQVQQLSQRQAVSSEQQFWSDLHRSVPDWQDVNASKEFQTWLLEVDPLTGNARQAYLDEAQKNLDATRVARFFDTWKGLTGTPSAQNARSAEAKSELEKQVAPGKGRSGGSKGGGEPKTYSPSDIKGFFSDVQKGKFKGRESERDRIERDIFAAQREGRIVTA